MKITEFICKADAYLKRVYGYDHINDYVRCDLLVQAAMYNHKFQKAFDQFEWSDENFEALIYNGDEINVVNGVPFVVGNCGGDAECCLTFIIYHDGNDFCIYFGEDADVDWRSWEDEDVKDRWTDDYVEQFIEWIKTK